MKFIIVAFALMAMFSTASESTGTSGTTTSTSTGGTSTGSTSTSTGGTSTGGTSTSTVIYTSTGGTSTGGTTSGTGSTSTSTGGTSTGSTSTSTVISTSTGGTSTGVTSTSTGGTPTGSTSTSTVISTSTGGTSTGTSTITGGTAVGSTSTSTDGTSTGTSTSTGGAATSSSSTSTGTSATDSLIVTSVLSAQVGVGEESMAGFVWTHKIQNPDLEGDVGCIYYAVTEKTETLSVAEMQDPQASGKVLNNHPNCAGKLLQHNDIQETRQDCPLEAAKDYWFWYGVDYNCDGTDAIINSPVSLKVPEAKDCVGHWEPCDSTCTSLYFLDNPQSGGGQPCPFQDLDSKTCTPGTDACPIPEPIVEPTLPPTEPALPSTTPRPPCFLPMEDTEEGSAMLIFQQTGCWPVESQEYDNDSMFGIRPGTIYPGTMPGMNVPQPAIGSRVNLYPYFNTDGDESLYNNMMVRGLPGAMGGMAGMGGMGAMGGYYFGGEDMGSVRLQKPRPATHHQPSQRFRPVGQLLQRYRPVGQLLQGPRPSAGRPTRPIHRRINPQYNTNVYQKPLYATHRIRKNPYFY